MPPEIEKPDEVQIESIKLGSQFSLYCPVFSTPLPEVKISNIQKGNQKYRFHGNWMRSQ